MPPVNAIIFTFITLGIYQLFWLYRVFKELHARGATETTPGKAVGFLFIPFFNFVWSFIVWKRLGDAVAHEYANARLPIPATGLVWLAPVAGLFGIVEMVAPPVVGVRLVLLMVVIGYAQSWMNQLASAPAGSTGLVLSDGRAGAAETKPCPTCGEYLSIDALLCRFCGRWFSEQEVTLLRKQREDYVARTAAQLASRSLASRKTLSQVFGWILVILGAMFLLSLHHCPHSRANPSCPMVRPYYWLHWCKLPRRFADDRCWAAVALASKLRKRLSELT